MNKKYIFAFIGLLTLTIMGAFLYLYFKPITLKVLEKDNLGYYFWVIENKKVLKGNVEFKNVVLPSEINNKDLDYVEAKNEKAGWIKDNTDVAVLSTDELSNMEALYPGAFKAVLFFSDTTEKFSTNIVVAKDSKIGTVKDLSKKTVAYATGTEGYLLEKYLKDSGVTDANLKEVAKKNWSEQLKSGKINAIWATEPQGTQLGQEGIGKKIIVNPNNNPKGGMSEAVTYVIAIKSDLIKTKGNKITALVDALKEAKETDEKELRQIMIEKLGTSWEKIVSTRTFPRVQMYSEIDRTLFEKLITDMIATGYLDKKIDINKMIYE